ncbi:MAG: Gfo/Idh/MocA family oxidoreductase [Elusimicrobiota bacterium]|jgi:predicted dehydrogenase|nr:Gfo/Idh/MocA family oxidoreductase [Elusimicrobiota bacterium]
MNAVCWGMIGCGSVAEKKSAPGLYKSQNSKLKSVYSRSYEKALDYAKRHSVPTVCRSLDDILADKEINAVYIATPPKSHKEYAVACLKAGKIPYVEKPFALNYQECLDILEISKQCGLPVYIAYYRRGLEKYMRIKSLIDDGSLGDIRFMRIIQFMKPEEADFNKDNLPWRVKMQETGGGKFIDMGTHILDLAEYFCGKIIEVSGNASNLGGLYDVEDTVSASLKCENEILISGSWCFVANYNKDEIEIIGSKGSITTTGLAYAPIKFLKDAKEEILEFKEPEHIAMPYEQLIINEIIGQGKSPADTLSAANNIKVIDEILKEYRKNR